jgi:CheY-like chemotaxis protein
MMTLRRLLIVDDEATLVELLAEFFRSHGFEVVTALNASEGLAEVSRNRPSVILMDGVMPGLTGWDVLRQLKTEPRTRQIPIVMMTGHIIDVARSNTLGAAALIMKPFSPPQLLETIDRVLVSGPA